MQKKKKKVFWKCLLDKFVHPSYKKQAGKLTSFACCIHVPSRNCGRETVLYTLLVMLNGTLIFACFQCSVVVNLLQMSELVREIISQPLAFFMQ